MRDQVARPTPYTRRRPGVLDYLRAADRKVPERSVALPPVTFKQPMPLTLAAISKPAANQRAAKWKPVLRRAASHAQKVRSEIPPPDIDVADRDRHDHHRERVERIGHKAERYAVTLCNAGDRKVRRRPDQRAIAAEAGAEREAPPQRLYLVGPAVGRRHALDQRDHGGDERDVVHNRRQDRRSP